MSVFGKKQFDLSTQSPVTPAQNGGVENTSAALKTYTDVPPASHDPASLGRYLSGKSNPDYGSGSSSQVEIFDSIAHVFENMPLPTSAPSNTNASSDHSILKVKRSLPGKFEEYARQIIVKIPEIIDLRQFSRMSPEKLRSSVQDFIVHFSSIQHVEVPPGILTILTDCVLDEISGLGPLEALLERDDISDIMVNGPNDVFIEINGKIRRTDVTFRSNDHLIQICQRIATRVGRRVDESSPICDARLQDGSRVNVILSPLALDGATLTIRRFSKEKLTLDKLLRFGTVSEDCALFLKIAAACRVNIIISGGTGSGKTTLLNCLTRYINSGERIITCEDAAELQLQQPHVVRLETRPPNIEGQGEVSMRDLVKNCLRMRPERIIVGEVRGAESFDLLQAMNTGHDGSMGTLHANSPREALSRLESMIAMAGLNIPTSRIREQIASALNIVIQVQRLRDGSRKVTHVSEITGLEGEVMTMQDLFHYEIQGEDKDGNVFGEMKQTGLRPRMYEKARQYGMEKILLELLGRNKKTDLKIA